MKARLFLVLALAVAVAVLVLAFAFARAPSHSDARSLSDDPTLLSHTVSAGSFHTCGVRTDGSLACWGNEYAVATPPAGTFTAVSAGDNYTCGVRTDGSLACWGDNDYGQAT
ncbi:MAG: RCC1 domain-containing protein, partial [Dehalococcoidia bacterium]